MIQNKSADWGVYQSPAPAKRPRRAVGPLTGQEMALLKALAGGKSQPQLAFDLGLTGQQLRWRLNKIYARLGVRSVIEAVAKAL